jgi:uncharacterized surface protein with fasciclin (FAS1) repeats
MIQKNITAVFKPTVITFVTYLHKLMFMKNFLKMRFIVLLFAAISIYAASCSDDNAVGNPAPVPNIAQIVAQTPEFSSLNTALVRTNLTGSLTSGNLTLFAPDNASFTASGIDANTAPVTKLDSILKYHVVGQSIGLSSFTGSDTLKSLLGKNIFLSKGVNGVFTNAINVKQTDIKGSNGFIHVVSKVLTPPTQSIAQIATADTSFSFLVSALTKLNLLNTVSGPGKFTVFAPTNAAFRAAGITDINAVPIPTLDVIVKYHILTTSVFTTDFINNYLITSLQGGNITLFTTPGAGVKITTGSQPASAITTANIVATNGVMHVINKVMLP